MMSLSNFSDDNNENCISASNLVHNIGEFDRIIGHADFGCFIILSYKIKLVRYFLSSGNTMQNEAEIMSLDHLDAKVGGTQVANLIELIRLKLASKTFKQKYGDVGKFLSNIPRGVYPLTDNLMDESIEALKNELQMCIYLRSIMTNTCSVKCSSNIRTPKRKKLSEGLGDAIAIKYSKRQTDILTDWMIENKSHPFPDSFQIKKLSIAVNLTYSQVVNWTTNVRKRNLKATVEGGKKPHHFLDFLFLADDREKKKNALQDEKCLTPKRDLIKKEKDILYQNLKASDTLVKQTQKRQENFATHTTSASLSLVYNRPGVTLDTTSHPITPILGAEQYRQNMPLRNGFQSRYFRGYPGYYNIPQIPLVSYPESNRKHHVEYSAPYLQGGEKYCMENYVRAVSPTFDEKAPNWHASTAPQQLLKGNCGRKEEGGSYHPIQDMEKGAELEPFEIDNIWDCNVEINKTDNLENTDKKNDKEYDVEPKEKDIISQYTKSGLLSTPTRSEEDDELWEDTAGIKVADGICNNNLFDDCFTINSDSSQPSIVESKTAPKCGGTQKESMTSVDVADLLSCDFDKFLDEELVDADDFII